MKKVLAVLLSLVVALAPSIVAAQPSAVYYRDSQGRLVLRTGNEANTPDANGALPMAEMYPREFQSVSEIIYGTTVATGNTEITSNPFSNAGVYGIKYLRIKQTAYASGLIASGLAGGVIYRIKGSMDGVNYHPIIFSQMAADTIKVDSLQYKLMSNAASPAANGLWFPLVNPLTGGPLPFRFLQVAMFNRGSATVTTELEVAGRQY